jgi:hypothetical protein
MHKVEERTSWDAIVERARRIAKWRRKRRRIKRLDVLVASALLLLLIFGWVTDFVRAGLWPGSNLLTATSWHHAWSLR